MHAQSLSHTLHGVGLAGTSLTVSEDAHVVAVQHGSLCK